MGGKSYRRKKAEGVSGASNRKPSVREKDKFYKEWKMAGVWKRMVDGPMKSERIFYIY